MWLFFTQHKASPVGDKSSPNIEYSLPLEVGAYYQARWLFFVTMMSFSEWMNKSADRVEEEPKSRNNKVNQRSAPENLHNSAVHWSWRERNFTSDQQAVTARNRDDKATKKVIQWKAWKISMLLLRSFPRGLLRIKVSFSPRWAEELQKFLTQICKAAWCLLWEQ